RAEHPRGRQIHPLHDRPVLRERADGPAQQGAVRFRLIQRRTCAHPAAAREGRGSRPRPEQVVQQRRDRRGREHRPRDRAVRREHLQVLPCVPDGRRADEAARASEGGFVTGLRRAALAGAALFASFVLPAAPVATATTGDDPVTVAISAELESLMSPDGPRIHGVTVAMQEIMQTFYTRRGFRAAWEKRENADELLAAIEGSYDDGLDPADYQLALLQELTREVRQPSATATLRGQYDVLMTESLLRLGRHLSFGKVDAATFDAKWNYGRGIADRDIPREIEEALAAGDLGRRIEALKPTHRLYLGLKRELARYRAASTSELQPIRAGTALKPGESDARIPLLRARLAASGDLDAATAGGSQDYDAALESAVRRFQARMGLEADGVAGAGTIEALNVPVSERIRQLRIN